MHGALLAVSACSSTAATSWCPASTPCATPSSTCEHPGRLLRLTVIRALPHLAKFGPDAFARYLKTTVAHLVKAARPTSPHKTCAPPLLSLGDLALAMEDHLLTQDLPTLVALVLDSMTNTRAAPFCLEVLKCTSNLVEALRENISPDIQSLLDPMLGTGLSKALISTLITIARALPDHKALIQQRLLGATTVLGGKSYVAPGMSLSSHTVRRRGPASRSRRSRRPGGGRGGGGGLRPGSTSLVPLDAVLLSLQTLASFRMDGVPSALRARLPRALP